MDERAIGQELERDLLRAAATSKVLYLEGPTDVLMLVGLLGRDPPNFVPEEGLPVDGVWVRGLSGSAYAPYAALNRVVSVMHELWSSLGVARFGRPIVHQPLRTTEEIRIQLQRDEGSLRGFGDLVELFDAEVKRCDTAVATSLAHALVNGKWLVEVHAAEACHRGPVACRQEWAKHVGRSGGHPEVIEWWRHFLTSDGLSGRVRAG